MIDPAALPPDARFRLPVVETFHSLQGEGLHAGRSAFFLRLGGCAVGCPWCDTKHSWSADAHPQRSLAELTGEARAAAAAGAAFAVVTGGEPLEHDLGPLCAALDPAATGLPLHLETSGAAPLQLSGRFAWITLSPKRHRPPSPELLDACDELKVVVHEPADLAFAEAMAAEAVAARLAMSSASAIDGGIPGDGCESAGVSAMQVPAGPALLLQPGWNCRRGQELAIEFVRSHPAWRLSLQSHKWLGVR
ncbi:radical SAM protein [Synechococcus sp. CBW1004]|uniref:7-carboxy-7-deazaguanine synthase QueE n=1 Tax=Synechococcus sp. CBW1004 TaxID=1353136 RepID=UPI0018CFA29A|nr:radical SAM protein [Synechococcus sp. CBW1004]QPN62039.1 radical SAM protein [Synechococcus sp. CBW1004]